MTSDEENKQQADDHARKDLAHIMALKDSDPFNLYYMRRLRQRIAETEKRFKYDKMEPNEREATRLLFVFLEKLVAMPDEDEATLKNQLGTR